MKSTAKIRTLVFFLLGIFLVSSTFAAVEVFSNYDTTLQVFKNNTIVISKDLTLKNVYDVGIVPGQIEFKLAKGTEGSVGNVDVLNVKAVDRFGKEIKNQVRKTADHTIIVLDVYYPLLPGFEYTFDLEYTLSFEPGGIFFKSLQIPLRESTIPIQQGDFKVILPDNYYFTHLDSGGSNFSIDGNTAEWKIKNDLPHYVTFEYSYLPIRIFGLKGSYVFWISINMLLILILFIEIRRELKKAKKGKKGSKND